MGISPGWLALFSELCRDKSVRPGDAVLDFGASELFCADEPQSLNGVLAAVGAPLYAPGELATVANRSYAADLFRRAGFRYEAIDYADYPGVIRLDLNTDVLPAEHHGRFQFINNCGTSEHILNQWNVFKVMHEAARPGAIMYHGVPGWGDFEHGIFQYSPKFFWALAEANGYDILRFWAWSNGKPEHLDIKSMPRIAFTSSPIAEKVWLHLLLRKSDDRPFAGLYDPAFHRDWRVPQDRLRVKSRSLAKRMLRPAVLAALLLGRKIAERIQGWAHS